MTELLQQAIAKIEKLPPDQQDAIATRFLAELQDEEKWETHLESDHIYWYWIGAHDEYDELPKRM